MRRFGAATQAWFRETFAGPTPVQRKGWKAIAGGEHTLLIAPTGSGKTLAAFLWCIDRLSRNPQEKPGVRTLYVSPLKALVYDVERNLRAPLTGIARVAQTQGTALTMPKVAIRTGDTPSRERQRQARDPAEILVTTPESLYLILNSQARETLTSVDTVIVDEVHALAPSKRGAHLAISLERLAAACSQDPQRLGLSATARPLEEVARFLGGDRDVSLIDTSAKPHIDVQIVVPVPDMTEPTRGWVKPDESQPDGPASTTERALPDDRSTADASPDDADPTIAPAGMGEPMENSIWPAVYPRLLELVAQHRTTIIFVNSRGLCERLAQRLNESANDDDLVRAHHGSVAREQREQIEEMLKQGEIKAIVATSSLELGIDMGTVDLVVLVESPGAVARGLQRIGRAGHGVGEVSRGRLFPKHRGDLLECAVVTKRMQAGSIESLRYPRNPLDVVAQQIVAMVAVEDWTVDDLERLLKRAANFRELPKDAYIGVLDMLAGRYPSHAFADLRPRLTWDRVDDRLTARRGSKLLANISGGTIPDRGTFGVFLGQGGPRVGELDEEMVHESAAGQNITLGATTWKIEQITRDRVVVSAAPGEPGRLPFWRGDGPGRPADLGRAIGAFLRTLSTKSTQEGERWLESEYNLDAWAARNLVAYVTEQREATGTLPTDKAITIERFRDELGDWRICILCPLGARINAPWALALQTKLEATVGFEVQALWNDDGIVLRLVEVEDAPDLDLLLPDPDEVKEQIVDQLAHSALFTGQFRENAARSLLLPRQRAGARMPLWQQRLKSQQLLAVAREYPSFPIIIETYRSCLQDIFDLPGLVETLRAIRSRKIRVDSVETAGPSPFSRSLVFAYVAVYMYEGDAPLAERKAQALALDRKLLRELLGQEELRELLDRGAIDQVEDELQGLAPNRRAKHIDAVTDLLRRVGDLDVQEIAARCNPQDQAETFIRTLVDQGRVLPMRVGGVARYVATEDAGLFRDALGCQPPVGVPKAFLEPVLHAWDIVVERYAKTHAPFVVAKVADRYRVTPQRVIEALTRLEAAGKVIRGGFRPGGTEPEWCDPAVLRRIKSITLAKLRGEIEPVEAQAVARFLPDWHGIGQPYGGPSRLEEVLIQLEGLPLSYAELESVLLPARIENFSPRMLDELGALGWLVWVGHGALGKSDGRVALYRRERVGMLLDPPTPPEDLDPLHHDLLDHLEQRGASFFVELHGACGTASTAEVQEALWDLVWHGLVTNDTLSALRAHGRPTRARKGSRQLSAAVGGRWSLVSDLLNEETNPTQRAHAQAIALLERHGIVSRETVDLEALPGGFSAVYRVLKAMEESGKVLRGYFAADLTGAQFASPGAIDRLRGHRDDIDTSTALVLSAVDPANPFGWMLPWPHRDPDNTARPRRVAGAVTVLVGGRAVLYLDKGGRRLVTFPAFDDPEIAVLATKALTQVAARHRGKYLRIEKIDGTAARKSPHAAHLLAAAFTHDLHGLVYETRTTSTRSTSP